MAKVFINAGHGDHDPGACNKTKGFQERNIVRLISDIVSLRLQNLNIQTVVYQEHSSLNEVPKEANNSHSDIFVSIHMNSATSTTAKGVETLYYNGSTQGEKLATCIQNEFKKPINGYLFANRGTKVDTRVLLVLRATNMPSCLVEVGFISNNEEAVFVNEHIDQCAEAIVTGIVNYLQDVNLIKKVEEKSVTSDLVIKPVRRGVYNLFVNGTLMLKENKITTIDDFISKNYI